MMDTIQIIKFKSDGRSRDIVPKYFQGNQSLNHLSIEQAVQAVQCYPIMFMWLPKHLKKPEVELASKL